MYVWLYVLLVIVLLLLIGRAGKKQLSFYFVFLFLEQGEAEVTTNRSFAITKLKSHDLSKKRIHRSSLHIN